MKISISEAKRIISKSLEKHGYNSEEVENISEVIMYSVLKESSQGFAKIFGWRIEKDPKAEKPIFSQSGAIIRADGKRNNQMFVCNLAIPKLILATEKFGIASAGIYNLNNSSGAIGYYTAKLAKSGFVGIMFSSADPGIAPAGIKKPIFGTNPISFAMPGVKNPIVLDFSTAKYTWGDLVKKANSRELLEKGFAIDKEGKPTVDAEKAKWGAVSPFENSHKGVGLSMIIQILGGLVGSDYDQNYNSCDYGSLIIAIDPERFGGLKFLQNQAEKIIQTYKKESLNEVFYPGEKGQSKTENSLKNKEVEIDEVLYKKILDFIEEK